jgi:drug/metabolite transporter (DMT)-like permease
MNIGYVLGAAFGSAIGPTLLMFGLSALAIQNHRKAKLGWWRTLALFVVAVLVGTAMNPVLYFFNPSLLTSTEFSTLDILQIFVIPLLVSVATILLLWKPKTP